jgi:single-strand DNA-binding protein
MSNQSLNSILVEGNLTRDPEIKTTPTGRTVADLHIANNRFYRRGEELQKSTSFFAVEAWEAAAEPVRELAKGYTVRVVGRLKQDRWEGPDGTSNQRVKIVAEHVTLLRVPQAATAV